MVIKSPFKDYYDWVANRYGGGDPKIVYTRGRIFPQPRANQLDGPQQIDFGVKGLPDPNYRYHYSGRPRTKWYILIVVAGKLYRASTPVRRTVLGEEPQSTDLTRYILEPLIDEEELERRKSRWYRDSSMEYGKEYPQLIELSRKIGHPVFVVLNGPHRLKHEIHQNCPILGPMGFPSLISAEQMYQELAYFMGNLMRKSPDVQPPVELSNKQKIIKAGFDLVKSFRHRK